MLPGHGATKRSPPPGAPACWYSSMAAHCLMPASSVRLYACWVIARCAVAMGSAGSMRGSCPVPHPPASAVRLHYAHTDYSFFAISQLVRLRESLGLACRLAGRGPHCCGADAIQKYKVLTFSFFRMTNPSIGALTS